jgi:hypothetical protein
VDCSRSSYAFAARQFGYCDGPVSWQQPLMRLDAEGQRTHRPDRPTVRRQFGSTLGTFGRLGWMLDLTCSLSWLRLFSATVGLLRPALTQPRREPRRHPRTSLFNRCRSGLHGRSTDRCVFPFSRLSIDFVRPDATHGPPLDPHERPAGHSYGAADRALVMWPSVRPSITAAVCRFAARATTAT